jgi:hypothetical protein
MTIFYSKSKKGFYDSSIHGDAIPADAVEITVEEHRALLGAQSTGQIITSGSDGKPITIDPPPLTLDQLKAAAYAEIDFQAGETRKKYITDVAGQSETYLLKSADAQSYKAAGYPSQNIDDYPMVRAEAMALYGDTPSAAQYQSASDFIINTQSLWLQLAADIERHRRTGKEAVTAANTDIAVETAKQAAVTALSAL